jgi:hypothetical protein
VRLVLDDHVEADGGRHPAVVACQAGRREV